MDAKYHVVFHECSNPNAVLTARREGWSEHHQDPGFRIDHRFYGEVRAVSASSREEVKNVLAECERCHHIVIGVYEGVDTESILEGQPGLSVYRRGVVCDSLTDVLKRMAAHHEEHPDAGFLSSDCPLSRSIGFASTETSERWSVSLTQKSKWDNEVIQEFTSLLRTSEGRQELATKMTNSEAILAFLKSG